MRADRGVGAKRNLDPGLQRAIEGSRSRRERRLRLGRDLRRIVPHARLSGDVFPGHQRRHEIGAVLLHHPHGLVIEKRPVFDRVDAGADRDLRPFGAVRVCGRPLVQPVRFIDEGIHFGLRELRRIDLVGEREHTAGCADLDDVGAVFHLEAHRIAELIRPACDAVGDPGLCAETLIGKTGIVAVAAAGAERVHRDEHPRPDDQAGGDGVAEPDVDVV